MNQGKLEVVKQETLQIAVKRRQAKSKGGKERYTHLVQGSKE